MNEKLLVGIGVGAACIGILVSTAVHAQNVNASKSPSARASDKTSKTTRSKQNQSKQQPSQNIGILADTLDRHCGNCNHLAMFRYEQDREPVYTRVKTSEDLEFDARIRQNFLDNYLAGNIRGPFHQTAGVCICGRPHDLNTQIEVNIKRQRVEAAAAIYNLELAAKQKEQQQQDPNYRSDELVEELRKANEYKAREERRAEEKIKEEREQRRVDGIEQQRRDERFLRELKR